MKKKLEALKKNKKGFSLIELIIVIAIMAILIGIVASQVIPYMEKSRRAKDQQQLSAVTTAIVSAIAQCDTQPADMDGKSLGAIDGDLATNLAPLLENGASGSKMSNIEANIIAKFKSKEYAKDGQDIKVSYKADDAVTIGKKTYPKGSVIVYVNSGDDPSEVASSDTETGTSK